MFGTMSGVENPGPGRPKTNWAQYISLCQTTPYVRLDAFADNRTSSLFLKPAKLLRDNVTMISSYRSDTKVHVSFQTPREIFGAMMILSYRCFTCPVSRRLLTDECNPVHASNSPYNGRALAIHEIHDWMAHEDMGVLGRYKRHFS